MNRCTHSFPWRNIGKVKTPTRVSFFTWTAAKGNILTLDNWRKRNICVVNQCCMCKNMWTIFLFIACMHIVYGLLCFVCWVSLGCCPSKWWSCLRVGKGVLDAIGLWLFWGAYSACTLVSFI